MYKVYMVDEVYKVDEVDEVDEVKKVNKEDKDKVLDPSTDAKGTLQFGTYMV